VVAWWRTKYPDDFIKGSKINLQHAFGTRIPNGVLNFFFKFSYARKVGASSFAKGALHCCTADTEIYKLILFAFFHSLIYLKVYSGGMSQIKFVDLW
jgi:hypothetical protein